MSALLERCWLSVHLHVVPHFLYWWGTCWRWLFHCVCFIHAYISALLVQVHSFREISVVTGLVVTTVSQSVSLPHLMSGTVQQSVRIHCPSYQPRTTWNLLEIVSVCWSLLCTLESFNDRWLLSYLKGVAPTAYQCHSPTFTVNVKTSHSRDDIIVPYVGHPTVHISSNDGVQDPSSEERGLDVRTSAPGPLFCAAQRPVEDSLSANDLGIMNVQCPYCDALHWPDEHVLSSTVSHPEFQTCCTHGKVKLPPLWIPPAPLYNLFTGNTPDAKEFRSNIV